jgi:hypothetical protein
MKKSTKKSAMLQPSEKPRVIEFPQISTNNQHEQVIETRLRNLTVLVADLTESGYGILLLQETSTREAFNELRVKEAALRWIIRVAKHSTGAVREKLWSEIEQAVYGLEKTAQLLLQSGLAGRQSATASHRIRLAGPRRF